MLKGLTKDAERAVVRSWDGKGEGVVWFNRPGLDWLLNRSSTVFSVLVAWGTGLYALYETFAAQVAMGRALAAFAMGALLWTLLEYVLHRFAFHFEAASLPARVVLFMVHGHHHDAPGDPHRLAATPLQFTSLGLLLFGILRLPFDTPTTWSIMAGLSFAYGTYEWLHHGVHHGRARKGLRGALRRHHLRHHLSRPDRNFGISSPLWDYIFFTRG